MKVANRWTRWHSDEWTGVVVLSDRGDWFYNVWQGAEIGELKPATGRADAQHQAEDVVRASGHRCTARCSFWVPDTPED